MAYADTLFRLPAGCRIGIMCRSVSVSPPGGPTLTVRRAVFVDATATDDREVIDGRWHRRFADCAPPLVDYSDDVWVQDGDVANDALAATDAYAPAEDFAASASR